jgi:hypothetical protein
MRKRGRAAISSAMVGSGALSSDAAAIVGD